ncbi:MAG: primosomal protein N' [Hydrogenobacter sp.]
MNLKVALSNGRILRLSLDFPYEGEPIGYRVKIPSLGRTGIVVGLSQDAQQSLECIFPDKKPLVLSDVIETLKDISLIYGINPWYVLFSLLPKHFVEKQEDYVVPAGSFTVGLDKVSMKVIKYVIAKGGVKKDLLKNKFGCRLVEFLIDKGFLKVEKRWNVLEEEPPILTLHVPFEEAYKTLKNLKRKEEKLTILNLVKERGYVSIEELEDMGFSSRDISYLLKKGILAPAEAQDVENKTQTFGPLIKSLGNNEVLLGSFEFLVESLKSAVGDALQRGFSSLVVCTNLSTLFYLEREFKSAFGDDLLLISSKEKPSRLIRNWFKAQEESKVVLGSFLSLLVPIRNVKVVALFDDTNIKLPKAGIDVRNLLYMRSRYLGASFVICTPAMDIQTYHLVKSGRIKMDQCLSDVQVQVVKRQGKEIFSAETLKVLEDFLDKKVLFLINKKGYSYAYCPRCQNLCMCPVCETFLTLYKDDEELVCTNCNFKSEVVCPECGGAVESSSFGIDRVMEEVENLFGLRENFTFSTYPTLSDFYHLVVVVSADNLLSVPFFNAEENFYRYVWRARALAKEKLLIQTLFAEHSILEDIKRNHWENYLDKEWERRKEEHLPPFSRMILASFSKDVRKSLESLGVKGRYRKTKRGIDALLRVNSARMGEVLKKVRSLSPLRLEIF